MALTLWGAGLSVKSGRVVYGRMEKWVSISGQNSWLEAEGHQAVVTSGRIRLEAASAVSSAGPAGPKACLSVRW